MNYEAICLDHIRTSVLMGDQYSVEFMFVCFCLEYSIKSYSFCVLFFFLGVVVLYVGSSIPASVIHARVTETSYSRNGSRALFSI